MVPRDGIDGRFNLRESGPIHGILHGVGGVIHEVPRHKDIGGRKGIGGHHRRLHQGIRMGVPVGLVNEAYLGIAHLNEGERLKGVAGCCQHKGYSKGICFHCSVVFQSYALFGEVTRSCGLRKGPNGGTMTALCSLISTPERARWWG